MWIESFLLSKLVKLSKMKITVAIPCYNLENRVSACIESVMKQDFEDFEVLLIDDCSSDKSVMVARREFDKHPEISCRIIRNEVNLGLSSVRNIAIMEAQGECLFFVDGDDILEPGAFALLYQKMQETGAEVVCGSFRRMESDRKTVIAEKRYVESAFYGEYAYSSFVEKHVKGFFQVAVWNNLYRMDFIRSHNLCFPTTYRIFEDCLFTFYVMMYTKSIVFIDTITYNYIKYPASISEQIVDPKWFNSVFCMMDSIFCAFAEFRAIHSGKRIPYGILFLLNYICLTIGLLKRIVTSDATKEEKVSFLKWLKVQYGKNNIKWKDVVGPYNKISYCILMTPISYPLFLFYFRNLKPISKMVRFLTKQ